MFARNARSAAGSELDEARRSGAARQRFQPKCARSGKAVQDGGALDQSTPAPFRVHQHIEQGLADPVGGGTGPLSWRRDQDAAAPGAGDDTHYGEAQAGMDVRAPKVRPSLRAALRDGPRPASGLGSGSLRRLPCARSARSLRRDVHDGDGSKQLIEFDTYRCRGSGGGAPAMAGNCSRSTRAGISSMPPRSKTPSWNGP